jgi:anti-anti-sigma regulatory factor
VSAEISIRGDAAVVTVTGDVGRDQSSDLLEAILRAAEGRHGPDVVVDVAGVTFLHDAVLETLGVGGRATHLLGGTFRFDSPSPAVMDAIVNRLCRPPDRQEGWRASEVI